MKERVLWVDYAKAIGIVLVVYGHVVRGLANSGAMQLDGLVGLIDSVIYSFHMPLFFFLSGLYFRNTFEGKGRTGLIAHKLDYIIYPYLLWSIFQGLVEAILSDFTNGNVGYSDVFELLWAPRAQFWFLYILFLAFFLMALLPKSCLGRMLPLSFMLSCIIYLNQSLYEEYLILKLLADNLVFFILGMVCMNYNITSHIMRWWVIIAILFTATQYYFHITLGLNYLDKGVLSLLTAVISIFLVIIITLKMENFEFHHLLLIGRASMAIYLIHILTGSGARVILNAMLLDNIYLHVVAGCVSGIVFPVVAFKFVERFKMKYVFSGEVAMRLLNKLVLKGRL